MTLTLSARIEAPAIYRPETEPMPHRLVQAHPLAVFLTAPLARMSDMPLLPAVLTAGLFTNLVRSVASDPFTVLLPLILLASGYDWWYGRRAARLAGTFRPDVALVGLHQKIGAVGIVCFIRALEAWSAPHLFETNGIAAVVIGLGIILEELSSVEEKRVRSGARPLFLLSNTLAAFRGVLQRLAPTPPSPPPPPAA